MGATSSEVHPALVQLRVAGFQRAGPVLPKRPAEHVHLVGQQREPVEGGDEAPVVDLGLGDPAEVAQFPELYVHYRQTWQKNTVQVGRFGKPVSEELLHATVLAVGLRRRVWLYL